MTQEDRVPSKDIALAGTSEPQGRVVIADEVELVLKRTGELDRAEITELLKEPRRWYPRCTGMDVTRPLA